MSALDLVRGGGRSLDRRLARVSGEALLAGLRAAGAVSEPEVAALSRPDGGGWTRRLRALAAAKGDRTCRVLLSVLEGLEGPPRPGPFDFFDPQRDAAPGHRSDCPCCRPEPEWTLPGQEEEEGGPKTGEEGPEDEEGEAKNEEGNPEDEEGEAKNGDEGPEDDEGGGAEGPEDDEGGGDEGPEDEDEGDEGPEDEEDGGDEGPGDEDEGDEGPEDDEGGGDEGPEDEEEPKNGDEGPEDDEGGGDEGPGDDDDDDGGGGGDED